MSKYIFISSISQQWNEKGKERLQTTAKGKTEKLYTSLLQPFTLLSQVVRVVAVLTRYIKGLHLNVRYANVQEGIIQLVTENKKLKLGAIILYILL